MHARTVIGVAAAPVFLALAISAHAAAGHIDPTFGSGGFVEHDMSPFASRTADPSGRFLVVSGNLLRRFLPDGSLDASFGAAGVVTLPSVPYPAHFARSTFLFAPNGDIVVRGSSVVTRLDANGAIVPTFGTGGVALLSGEFSGTEADGVYLPDDGIVIVRYGCPQSGVGNCLVAIYRHLADGSRDLSFGTAGSIVTLFPPQGIQRPAIGRQSDGALIVSMEDRVFRYLADGTPDATFGVSGGSTALPSPIGDMVVLPDDRIIVALSQSHQLARLNANGLLDPTFGTGGLSRPVVDTPLFSKDYDGDVKRLLVHGDGRATVVYSVNDSNRVQSESDAWYVQFDQASYVYQFTAAGEIDPSFAPCGFAIPAGIIADDAALLPGDQILLIGGLGLQLTPSRPGAYGSNNSRHLRFARLGTPAATTCLPAVPNSVRAFAKSGVHVKWKVDGDVPLSAFGDPLSTTGFGVCALPAGGLPGDLSDAVQLPGGVFFRGKPMWKGKASGYRLRRDNQDLFFASANLKAGPAGRALIDLRVLFGNVSHFEPVIVRLYRTDGPECWEAPVAHLR